ncbi:MAG: hypothetical protein Q4C49_10255 [Bacillota bacterium]|nr:hypothetical protein [Bacillota bacterium]
MCSNYSKQIHNSLNKDFDEYEAQEFLKNPKNFRPFSQGLSEALVKAGYDGDTRNEFLKAEYLWNKLKEIDRPILKRTIESWFLGTHRPKIEHSSRQNMYEICFALNFDLKDVHWFFQHVYFDRSFNYHNMEEAVYYYSFDHGLSLSKALEIIEEIKNAQDNTTGKEINVRSYTKFVQSKLDMCETEDELKQFLIQEKGNFTTWNQNAKECIQQYILALKGGEETKRAAKEIQEAVKQYKKGGPSQPIYDLVEQTMEKDVGLLLKYHLLDLRNMYGKGYGEELESKDFNNVLSNTFVLKKMYIPKNEDLKEFNYPNELISNFPSQKTLSNVLNESKIEKTHSYDTIRKTLVLLHFFYFWCNVEFNQSFQEYGENLALIYEDEINSILNESGYDDLYAGNPYDWLFLHASRQEDPLLRFTSLM